METKFFSPQNRTTVALAGAVVLILIIGLYLILNHPQTTTNTKTTTLVTLNTTTTILNTKVQNVSNGGGPGQSFLSRSETTSMIGAGGNYQAAYNTNVSQQAGILANNVTNVWIVSYVTLTANGTSLMYELVYTTPKAQFLYNSQLRQFISPNQTIGAVNASLNGLTYTYSKFVSPSSRGSTLLAYKHNELVVAVSPYGLNQSRLASLIAGDIP